MKPTDLQKCLDEGSKGYKQIIEEQKEARDRSLREKERVILENQKLK